MIGLLYPTEIAKNKLFCGWAIHWATGKEVSLVSMYHCQLNTTYGLFVALMGNKNYATFRYIRGFKK